MNTRALSAGLLVLSLLDGLAASPGRQGPHSDIYLTNKTRRTITLTYGGTLPAKGAYSWGATSVAPGKRARILTVSRDKGIKNGKTYEFHTRAELPNRDFVQLSQRLAGKLIGSSIWMSASWNGAKPKWYSDSNVTTRVADSRRTGSLTYAFDARWHFKVGWLYYDVEYTITETGVVTRANELDIWQHNIQQRPSSEGMKHQTGFGHSERSQLSTIALPEAIRRFDSSIDVITVNEAFTASLRPELTANMKKVGFLYSTDVLGKKGSAAWSGGVMVFSKHKITKTREHIYTHYASADRNADKGVLYARIDKQGRPYNIFATHTNASYDFKGRTRLPLSDGGRKARSGQFDELRQFIAAQHIPAHEPVIVIGDMNVDMVSELGKANSEYADMLRRIDAVHPTPSGHPYSLDKNTNEWVDADDGPPQLLDYILLAKGYLQPTSASEAVVCLKSNGQNIARKGRAGSFRDVSDHYPLHGKFVFPAQVTPAPRVAPAAQVATVLVPGTWVDSNGMEIAIEVSVRNVKARMLSAAGRRWWTDASGELKGQVIPAMVHSRGATKTDTQRGTISKDGKRIDWSNRSHWTLRPAPQPRPRPRTGRTPAPRPATPASFPQRDEDSLPGGAFSTADKPQAWLVGTARQWMGKLGNNVSLARISIPGTHDSGALHGGLVAQTQSWTIAEQLAAGIRYFDIRCRPTKDAFAIHHGIVFQKQMFGDVVDAMIAFLRSNPSEAIVMRWKTNEHTPEAGSKSARQISDSYLARYGQYFFRGNGTIPTLGQVRGKILVLRNGAIDPSYGIEWGAGADIQDYYQVFWLAHKQTKNGTWATLPAKKELVRSYLDRAHSPGKWVFNHLSGAVGMSPRDVARATDGDAYEHIGIYRQQKCLGTVIMDFPGDQLVYRILKSNFRLQPDGFVDCFCQAGYASKFLVSYTVDGAKKSFDKKLTLGQRHRFVIPGNARGLTVTGQWLMGSYKDIFTKRYATPPNKTLKVYGTVFDRKWVEE